MKLLVLLCCLFLLTSQGFGQKEHTPAAGTAERKAIMDALRGPAERDLKTPVIFKVSRLRVAGGWAFAQVAPIRPDGGKIDFSRTIYREQMDLGMFDPQGEALLRLDKSGWKVIEWAFGSTDVPSAAWPEKYRLPKSLFE